MRVAAVATTPGASFGFSLSLVLFLGIVFLIADDYDTDDTVGSIASLAALLTMRLPSIVKSGLHAHVHVKERDIQ